MENYIKIICFYFLWGVYRAEEDINVYENTLLSAQTLQIMSIFIHYSNHRESRDILTYTQF